MDGHNSDDDIYPEVVDESDEEDESSFKRARTFGTHACVYISASVLDFYYNATPKAPPKREYGEATRTLTPPHSRIIPLSPLRDVTTVK